MRRLRESLRTSGSAIGELLTARRQDHVLIFFLRLSRILELGRDGPRSRAAYGATMGAMAPRKTSTDSVLRELRAFGLTYPGAHKKSPRPGHLDLAVKDKTFAYGVWMPS